MSIIAATAFVVIFYVSLPFLYVTYCFIIRAGFAVVSSVLGSRACDK